MATPYSRSSQDSQPWQCAKEISRKLVVCIDGTSNKFGHRNTNIVELYSHIIKSDEQLTYYSSGLGAVAKVSGPSLRYNISNTLDMAIGRNLHKVIMASYRWLSDNYRDGDSVFLFGFSRGAYQVRALAGMIARVGLLLPGNNEQIPFAFELYSKTKDDGGKQSDEYIELAKTFRGTFCRSNVHIHFIGVWDTVSSVGFSRNNILPCTTTLCKDPHFCYFRHALALDERRVNFLPEYIYGGQSDKDVLASNGRIKEVWFAGCHGDVGGGNKRNEKLQLGDIPLLWMRNQATAVGLEMKPVDVMWKIDDLNKRITNSMRLLWWPMELWFFKHLKYSDASNCTHRPHFGGGRRIVKGQQVHVSVLFKNNYKPFAEFYDKNEQWPNPMFWSHPSSHEQLQKLSPVWEKDIFDQSFVRTLLDRLKKGQPTHHPQEVLGRLAFMSTTDVCKKEIKTCKDAEDILAAFLNNEDKVIQLSTAAMYCELGWDWPANTDEKLPQQIMNSVTELLDSNGCRSACIYLPSLCKKIPELIDEENLKKLVELCVGTRIDKSEEQTSTVAFPGARAMLMLMKRASTFQKRLVELCNGKRTEKSSTTFFESAHTLSMLMKRDPKLAQKLVDMVMPNITKMLHYKGDSALVALLSVVDGLATQLFSCSSTDPLVRRETERSRDLIEADTTVPIIHKLLKHYDDFVAPAAIRVLCSFLPHDKFRDKFLQCDVPHTLCQVLHRCSDETLQVACNALVKFMEHDTLRARMLECKVFPSLFDVLHQKCIDKTAQAVCNALVESVKHDNSRDKMLEHDVFRGLRDVLLRCSQADETVQVVCNTLVEFVKHADLRDKVLTHEVFTTLLDFKQWTSEQSMKGVCKVLVRFAEHENLRDKMLERDGLSTLCGVLRRRSDETTQAVCTTLGELIQYEKFREKMLGSDLFPLYDALQQRSGKTAEVVSNTLIKFVEHDNLRARILRSEVFLTLCQVLRQWNSDEHKQGVCNTLVEFVKYDNLRDEMLECDVFPSLCDVLCARSLSGKTKQKVCNTLVELAKHDKLRDKILQCNVLHALSQVVRRCSDETLPVVCNALVEFMKHDTLPGRMLECTVFPTFFDVLHRCSDETAQPLCNTLVESVEHENSRDKMLECDVFSGLVDVFQNAEQLRKVQKENCFIHYHPMGRKMMLENLELAHKTKMRQLVRKSLTKLVDHDNLRDKISECMMFPTLLAVFDRYYSADVDGDPTMEVVSKTVVEIMKHENLDRLFKSKVLHILCYVLGQCRSDKTKKAICDEFVEFVKCDTGKKKKLECMVLPTLCYVVNQHSDETNQMVCKTVVELGKHGVVVPKKFRLANNLCIFLSEVRDGNFTGSEFSGADEDMHEPHSPLLRRASLGSIRSEKAEYQLGFNLRRRNLSQQMDQNLIVV